MSEALNWPARDSEVFGILLHDLCQPLTTLRCSLELSLDEFTESQTRPVSMALEQADDAIQTVQLMREYLEVVRGDSQIKSVALAPAVQAVLEQLSVVAEVREVPLLSSGTSAAVLSSNEFWLHRALQYLIGSQIETQAAGTAITVLMEDHYSGSVVSVHSMACSRGKYRQNAASRVAGRLCRARIAISRRIFELAGATLAFYPGQLSSFVLRVPPASALANRMSA